MSSDVAFVEVHTEQGELVKRFTITRAAIREQGLDHLVRSAEDALPVTEIAREVWEAMAR